jgi:beta-phosphoglucomutase
MIGSLFFEVEGVLAATTSHRRTALIRALAEEGLVDADASDAVTPADDSGEGTRETVRRTLHGRAIDETTLTLIAFRANRHFASLVAAGVSLAPGARELIELSVASCRLAIVTGLDRATVTTMLSLADLEGAFEVIIAAEDVAAVKPAPDGHRKAIERMGRRRPVDIRTALALEPGVVGARAARAAGLRAAVVAPFRVESIIDADAMLSSLVGESPATLDAMLSMGSAR